MARYRVTEESGTTAIELTEVAGEQQDLLEAFSECQEGRCSCPTDEYRKVASMEVHSEADRIQISLTAKPGDRFDEAQIDVCLDHTVHRVGEDPRSASSDGGAGQSPA